MDIYSSIAEVRDLGCSRIVVGVIHMEGDAWRGEITAITAVPLSYAL
jgi:hypothetical protein